MKKFTIYTADHKFEFVGEIEYFNKQVVIYRLLKGGTITFTLRHITCKVEEELDETL